MIGLETEQLIIVAIACGSTFMMLSSIVDPNKLIVVVLAVVTGYIAFERVMKQRGEIEGISKKVQDITENIKTITKGQLINANKALTNAILGVSMYDTIDKGAFHDLVIYINKFYFLYGRILLSEHEDQANVKALFENMLVLRSNILNTLHSFYVKKHWLEEDTYFKNNVDTIVSNTRVPITVVKNKFPMLRIISQYPIASNEFDNMDLV